MEDRIMISLRPKDTSWCKIAQPHMTLVYAGKIEDNENELYEELSVAMLRMARQYPAQKLDVLGPDVFGDFDEVDVLKLEPSAHLLQMRAEVERWNKSEHSFDPHVTVGPVGSGNNMHIPTAISFDFIQVNWGARWVASRFTHFPTM